MPPRFMAVAIVAFWLATTGWMIYRDFWLRATEPPVLFSGTVEEMLAENVSWDVQYQGRSIGSGNTLRPQDALREQQSRFDFNDLDYRGWAVKGLRGTYRLSPRGELQGLDATVTWGLPAGLECRALVRGVVRQGEFQVLVTRPGLKEHRLGDNAMRANTIFNPLHPVIKIPGLWEGRSWRVVLLDPLLSAAAPGPEPPVVTLDAKVTEAWLARSRSEVACWRIDYHDADGERRARIWVRRSDNAVVRQEVAFERAELVFERRDGRVDGAP